MIMKTTTILLHLFLLKLTTALVINDTKNNLTIANNYNKPTGRYIVRLRKGVDRQTFEEEVREFGGRDREGDGEEGIKIGQRFKKIFEGFSGKFPESVAEALGQDDRVERVIPDVYGMLDQVQNNAEWALTRITHRNITSSKSEKVYEYPDHGGSGVKVYVMDSGVDALKEEFQDRLSNGYNFVKGEGWEDTDIHGTMVASLIGGTVYGVAKKVNLISVKVCGKEGCKLVESLSGFEWILKQPVTGPTIVNYSITMPPTPELDQVVEALVKKGVAVIVSAGNTQQDACDASPRRLTKSVLAVASTNERDELAWFSNYGPCVGIVAPGDNVKAARPKRAGPSYGEAGTSFSAPLVAGAAALLLSESPAILSPTQLYAELIKRATPNAVVLPPELKNSSTTTSLLYVGPSQKGETHQDKGRQKDEIPSPPKNVVINIDNNDPIIIVPHPIKNKL